MPNWKFSFFCTLPSKWCSRMTVSIVKRQLCLVLNKTKSRRWIKNVRGLIRMKWWHSFIETIVLMKAKNEQKKNTHTQTDKRVDRKKEWMNKRVKCEWHVNMEMNFLIMVQRRQSVYVFFTFIQLWRHTRLCTISPHIQFVNVRIDFEPVQS